MSGMKLYWVKAFRKKDVSAPEVTAHKPSVAPTRRSRTEIMASRAIQHARETQKLLEIMEEKKNLLPESCTAAS